MQTLFLCSLLQELKAGAETDTFVSMFTAVLFTAAKRRAAQVSINRAVDKHNAANTLNGIVFSLKEEENLTHATTWMNLEDFALGEMGQTQRMKTV